MDLFKTLKEKVEALHDGDYKPGMHSVLLHIEMAHRHLERGRTAQTEEPLFTDAIYRTNQAFEGSVKEAYRVLTGKDPAQEKPYDIEKYLVDEKVFRPRVLTQLTTYRKEWRNPSAHNYKLDFDESEAFLAIVNVSAFACLLIDQIAEHLTFEASKASAELEHSKLLSILPKANTDLMERCVALIKAFSLKFSVLGIGPTSHQTEGQILAALMGFISSAAPDLTAESDVPLADNTKARADIILSKDKQKILLELKPFGGSGISKAMSRAFFEHLMILGKINNGIIFFYPADSSELQVETEKTSTPENRIIILKPAD